MVSNRVFNNGFQIAFIYIGSSTSGEQNFTWANAFTTMCAGFRSFYRYSNSQTSAAWRSVYADFTLTGVHAWQNDTDYKYGYLGIGY